LWGRQDNSCEIRAINLVEVGIENWIKHQKWMEIGKTSSVQRFWWVEFKMIVCNSSCFSMLKDDGKVSSSYLQVFYRKSYKIIEFDFAKYHGWWPFEALFLAF